jgi:hypothetical protein
MISPTLDSVPLGRLGHLPTPPTTPTPTRPAAALQVPIERLGMSRVRVFILCPLASGSYDGPMTEVAGRQASSGKLQQALAAFKDAAEERRRLREGTEEYARALDIEEGWMHKVYELAAAIKRAPE